jgi:serine/threonine-protein kinase
MKLCPSSTRLGQWLADRLAGADAEWIEAHVETCVVCQQALERLTDDGSVRKSGGPTSVDESGGNFLRRLEQVRPAEARSGSGQNERSEEPRGPVPLDPGGGTDGLAVTVAGLQGPQSLGEIQTLLRKRLLFIAIVSAATFITYAVVFVFVSFDPVTFALYTFILALAVGLVVLLKSRSPLSLSQLRWIELVLFAGVTVFCSRTHLLGYFRSWAPGVADTDWPSQVLIARGLNFHWAILIISYGLLIPNTWRRCAVVVALMALWAVLLNAALAAGQWPVASRATFLVESALNVSLAAALAIFGSHRIEVLRQQAARARTLGQYRLKRRLGTGGMGQVYLAEHVLLRRPCALKLIRPERAGDPANLARFEREVQATATLTHPNTVEIFDYGRADDGTFYYAMEYLPGLSLQELVRRYGPLPPARAVHLLRQLCGALQEAHGAALIHRDVKPGNVLVCQRGGQPDVAKLLDFGLVRARGAAGEGEELTREGAIAGTPAYMSPEQAAGKADVDARSDLYSLGAVAYFLLTGRPPFVRDSPVQTLAAHLAEPVVAPDRHRPDIPADLQAVVLRCMEKDPVGRFPSADELAQALARCSCANEWTREQAAAWWRDHAVANHQMPDDGTEHQSSRLAAEQGAGQRDWPVG